MSLLYSWDASGPGAEGGGVTDDEPRAMRTAGKWMLEHGARTARIEEVRLASGGWGVSGYMPTGKGCTARRHGDEITWNWFTLERAAS